VTVEARRQFSILRLLQIAFYHEPYASSSYLHLRHGRFHPKSGGTAEVAPRPNPTKNPSIEKVKNTGAEISSKILPRRWGKVYLSTMTKLLEHAVDSVRALPPEVQDELARLLLQVAGEEQPVIQLTAEERADLAEADAEIARGEFATDEQIRSMLAKRTA
jgi:hypothetical protein